MPETTTQEIGSVESPPRVTIGLDDAKRLRAKAVEMKRYHLSTRYYADKGAEVADELIRLMDLIIETK